MLVKNIEQKIKINKTISLASILFAVIIVIVGFVFAYKLIEDSRKSLYVIDNGVKMRHLYGSGRRKKKENIASNMDSLFGE